VRMMVDADMALAERESVRSPTLGASQSAPTASGRGIAGGTAGTRGA
jgi:hypothetical protein